MSDTLTQTRSMSISPLVETRPVPTTPAELYLDLLKRTLTRTVVARATERQTIQARLSVKRIALGAIKMLLRPLSLELVRLVRCTPEDYLESSHASQGRNEYAETMLGTRQLDNMQACITDVLRRGVPGDLLEAGVWRGGMTILMRAVLKAHEDPSRCVWVADSFEGLPEPDPVADTYGWRSGEMATTLNEVRDNFARYGLLDDRVRFLKGFFSETLPSAPISSLAILRIDADLYGSTMDAVTSLYPKLSPGGYAIFDDYRNLADCRRAVDEYRTLNSITEQIEPIDSRAVFWRKGS